MRVAVPWSGCVPSLKEQFGCITFKGSLVGGPPWFGELEKCPHRFWYKSLTPIYIVYMLSMFISHSMFLMFVDYYENAMLIRLVIYMFSYFETSMFNMDKFFCVLTIWLLLHISYF